MTPIEQRMATALVQTEYIEWKFISGVKCGYVDCLAAAQCELDDECWALIFSQVSIGPYILDFLVVFNDTHGVTRTIAIECDGHDFHEKTKTQAAHDKKRDRYLAYHSITVLRFTGAEIWYDADSCAVEVRRTLGSISAGPRTTVWLGYLSEEELEDLMEMEYEAERDRQIEEMRKKENMRERALEIEKETRLMRERQEREEPEGIFSDVHPEYR